MLIDSHQLRKRLLMFQHRHPYMHLTFIATHTGIHPGALRKFAKYETKALRPESAEKLLLWLANMEMQ